MANKLITGGSSLGAGVCGAKINDAALVDILAAYRRRIAGNYRPLPPDDIGKLASEKMLVSPKIDGELWFLVSWSGEVFLANSKGQAIAGNLPLIAQASNLPDKTVIAGELHALVTGRRCRVGDLAAAMGGGNDARVADISFAGFDLLLDAGEDAANAYEVRHARLVELLKTTSNNSVIPVEALYTAAQIRTQFDAMVATGEVEGLIIRLDGGLIYKLKPSITIDAAIIAYTVKSDQPDLVRSVLLGLMHDDGQMQILGGCGNIGSDQERSDLLTKLKASNIDSSVRYASENGSLYTFVKPELVAEIRVTDLQADRSDGSQATSMVLSLTTQGWQGQGMRKTARALHPVMQQIRSDKTVEKTDIRFAQIAAYLPISSGTDHKSDEPATASMLIRREVWTKETKGQISVRKLLVWKTNKELTDRQFSAYVISWTDYSASRGSPLDREVRLAPELSDATKIADAMVSENIKKGWNKVM